MRLVLEPGDVYVPLGENGRHPERDAVLCCVSPTDPDREAALVAEGFCPRCGSGLLRAPASSQAPHGWCQRCHCGWSVSNARVTALDGEFLAWVVEMVEYDSGGNPVGKVGWARTPARSVL